jgi:hypothetical protein
LINDAEGAITAEEQLKYLDSMPLNELVANTSKILGAFPNTYTYTKNLC